MRHRSARVLSWGSMTQPIDATDAALAMVQQQLNQAMIEHQIVVQALRAQALVSALFILMLGSISYFLWRRHSDLNAAFLAEIVRHSHERTALVKQHSLERCSDMMQLLHAFEGIVSKGRQRSAPSPVSSVSTQQPHQQSTGRQTPVPPPLPPLPSFPSKRTPR